MPTRATVATDREQVRGALYGAAAELCTRAGIDRSPKPEPLGGYMVAERREVEDLALLADVITAVTQLLPGTPPAKGSK